jgi:hypothetical protein
VISDKDVIAYLYHFNGQLLICYGIGRPSNRKDCIALPYAASDVMKNKEALELENKIFYMV